MRALIVVIEQWLQSITVHILRGNIMSACLIWQKCDTLLKLDFRMNSSQEFKANMWCNICLDSLFWRLFHRTTFFGYLLELAVVGVEAAENISRLPMSHLHKILPSSKTWIAKLEHQIFYEIFNTYNLIFPFFNIG